MINVLFVCLGNICRSPMAEGVFEHLVKQKGLEPSIRIDSAGTSGYHRGSLPDPRMRETALQHGIKLQSRSRKFTRDDFSKFDYVIAMDDQNLDDILSLRKKAKSTEVSIHKMREFDNDASAEDVHDPYYDTLHGFERCYQIIRESCENFLNHLIDKHNLGSSQ